MSKRGLIFKTIAGRKPKTNVFDLSHEKKLSCDMAELVPIYLQECMPGDKFRGNTELYIKFAPLISPLYHRINAYIHYFFVPNRIVWDNWETFITGGVDGLDNRTCPVMTINTALAANYAKGTLADYFGIPPAPVTVGSNRYINALPFRAYQQVYNDYYRDQTLTTEVAFGKGDAVSDAEIPALATMRKRQWEKDRFTSALTTTQRGADVNIPMDPVYTDYAEIYAQGTGQSPITTGGQVSTVAGTPGSLTDGNESLKIENIESMQATINDLRTSVRLQEWLEKNARAGSRYIEQILAHFGVKVPDYRLQRAELIGTHKQTVMISEVLANMESEDVALGKMAGHAVSAGAGSGFKYTCLEHGYIIGILSVLPRTCYGEGFPRMFFKEDKLDFPFPEFGNLGEQPVYTNEIWDNYSSISNKTLFGYQSQYAEHKYQPDTVHGDFRDTLDFWHLGRKFSTPPVLNNSFTEANPDTRIFAIQNPDADHLWIQAYNSIQAIRPLPVFGTPIL